MPLFHVTDMECDACVRAITNAVHEVDRAATVAVDLPAGLVRVDNAAAAPERLAEAMREAGFTVTG